MDSEGRRSMSWSPPKWRRKTLCNEDDFSSDEDVLPSAKWNRRTQAASRTEGLKLKPSVKQLNIINLQKSRAESLNSLKKEEDHLHGNGWQDPICALFQKSNEWQDPICTLFQTENSATYKTESLESDGSCKLVTPPDRSTTSSSRTNSGKGGVLDSSYEEEELYGPLKSAQRDLGGLSSIQYHCQANLPKDIGFPPELIEWAIQLHGAEAEDSIILQFLLDWREKNAPEIDYKNQDKSDFKFQNKNCRGTDENTNGILTIRQRIANSMRKETEQIWDNDDSDSSDSDFDDDDDETIRSMPPSYTDWNVRDRFDNPPLFKRKLQAGEGHRNSMKNHGFESNVVDRAIQELGEGVEYDMLLEYLLYLTAQQHTQAPSTLASCEKRASVTKNLIEEHGCPSMEQASCKKPVTTTDKLVEGCGNQPKAVERAVANCETSHRIAKQDRTVNPVDFLGVHGADLNKSESESHSDEDPVEDTDWSWLRQNVGEDLSTNISGKRKFCYRGVPRRKPIIRLNHPSSFKRDQFDQPPLIRRLGLKPEKSEDLPPSRRLSVKREKSGDLPSGRRPSEKQGKIDDLSSGRRPGGKPGKSDGLPNSRPIQVKKEQVEPPPLRRRQILSRMPKVKMESSQRRVVSRIGRPRLIEESTSVILNKHKASVGFGLPGSAIQPRHLDEDVKGAPFFYFENVASMPNDEWKRIRRHLFDIEPEFVDSLHFSACRRPRGYIHNLPIEGRRKILSDPPMTIQELLPHTKAFWPTWDPRTKLNCITTRMGSEFLIKKLHIGEGTALQTKDPSPDQQREILHLCRHWNLVWTAPNIPTPIDETEIEAMLGFDAGHSRNILSSRSRYKALGNSFSVYTIAFHFSVLKPLYPKGIKVLSLFSGIGGAEVALNKMGMKLLVVVSVEIDDGTRRCLEAWWASSNQTGILNQNYHNIKDLGRAQISELVSKYGGFDLIVGGTPCNNLSGSNHVTRVGLDGNQSAVFFEFSRVVAAVRELTMRLQRKK